MFTTNLEDGREAPSKASTVYFQEWMIFNALHRGGGEGGLLKIHSLKEISLMDMVYR